MRKIFTLTFLLSVTAGSYFFYLNKEGETRSKSHSLKELPSASVLPEEEEEAEIGTEENPTARADFELLRLQDPASGRIPVNIRNRELRFASQVNQRNAARRLSNNFPIEFKARGPVNVGGRTRALAFDITDANTILAGGIAGGMWKTTDGGTNWTQSSHMQQHPSVSCLVQDIRTDKTHIWYHGSGEIFGNSTSKSGAVYRGDGIFKSTDNGDSWQIIESTSTGDITVYDSPFNYVNNIATDPSNLAEDEVYAAVYSGIVRSTDGFENWEMVLGGEAYNYDGRWTDVAVTSEGVVYATISNILEEDNPNKQVGIYRSEDGINWTEITPPSQFNSEYRRTVIGVSPSEENIVYFLGTKNGGSYSLHQYNATDGSWDDRSFNLPDFGEPVGDYDSQGSYNMLVKVHPENSDIVYIGGTNLYRSTDGFASKENTSWIGGYSPDNNVSQYPNHHPDQHVLCFSPVDVNTVLSGHDGGISITSDNLADNVEWTSLNNGYQTTQFYAIDIAEQALGDYAIVGGLQDNSTFMSTDINPEAPWKDVGTGDGAYCELTYNSLIVSWQNAAIYRYTYNPKTGATLGGDYMRPPSDGSYLFINPFATDLVDENKLYIAAKGEVYYTEDLRDQKDQEDWKSINNNLLSEAGYVTSFGLSKYPSNLLYIGTSEGKLFRIDDTNNMNAIKGITGDNFPAGYINNIAVDPENGDKVFAVFSNYGVLSIFYSDNRGADWTPVSGNLEQNPDGSGNGPATTWLDILKDGDNTLYLLGTSVGLYSTEVIDGMNTIWVQKASETIGNTMVDMVKVRDTDGYIAVGTHGRGVYDGHANISSNFKIALIGDANFCDGKNVTLRSPLGAGANYQWYLNNTIISGATEFEYTATEGGSYHIVMNDETGNTIAVSEPVEVIVKSEPEAKLTLDGNRLIAPNCQSCEYIWYDKDGLLIKGKSLFEITIDPSEKNSYMVAMVDECYYIISERLTTGILANEHDKSALKFNLFPNPAQNVLNVEGDKLQTLTVYSLTGQQLMSAQPAELDRSSINISHLPKGTYVLHVQTENQVYTKRFLKE